MRSFVSENDIDGFVFNNFFFKKMINRFLFIQSISTFSQWIDIFLIFLIPSFLWKSTPQEIGLIATSFALSGLVFGPIIGVFIDRSNPIKVMCYSSIARVLLSVALCFSQEVIMFSFLVVLKGVSNTFYWPASSVVTNKITTSSIRNDYFSKFSFIDQFAKIMTPLLMGFLTLYISIQYLFLFSALVALLVLPLLHYIKLPLDGEFNNDKKTLKSIKNDFSSGFLSIKYLPTELIISIVATIFLSFSLFLYDPHLANFLRGLNYNENTYSLLLTSTAVGALVGALLVKTYLNDKPAFFLIKNGLLVFTSSILIFIILSFVKLNDYTLIIIWFLNGFGYELFLIGANVNFQNLCPPSFLGRVSTILRSLQLLMLVLASNIGAFLSSYYSNTTPFFLTLGISFINLLFVSFFIRKHLVANNK